MRAAFGDAWHFETHVGRRQGAGELRPRVAALENHTYALRVTDNQQARVRLFKVREVVPRDSLVVVWRRP